MDDKEKKGPQDSSRINTHEDYEVKYWTTKFACSAAELVNAVKAVGSSVEKVEAYLKQNK